MCLCEKFSNFQLYPKYFSFPHEKGAENCTCDFICPYGWFPNELLPLFSFSQLFKCPHSSILVFHQRALWWSLHTQSRVPPLKFLTFLPWENFPIEYVRRREKRAWNENSCEFKEEIAQFFGIKLHFFLLLLWGENLLIREIWNMW